MPNYPKIREALGRRKSELDEVFEKHRAVYRDLQEYIAPWSGLYLDSQNSTDEVNDGDRKDLSILDPTAVFALDILAAGMQSGLTSPARPWFRLGLPDEDLREDPEVKTWLYTVENILRYIFSRSNFYRGTHHSYKELGAFGTAAMAMLFNYNTVIRCRPFTCGEYRIALGGDLNVNTFLHVTDMSNRQLIENFGRDNCSQAVVNAYDNGSAEKLRKIGWLVEPNDDRLPVKDFMGRPYRAIYFEIGGKDDKFLDIGGFDSFPIMTPRWFTVGNQVYGAGPGHVVLGHTRMLQKMQEKGLVSLDKSIDPPVVVPSNAKKGVNTMPGGVTVADEMGAQNAARSLYEVRYDPQSLNFAIQDIRTQIRTGLFNDLFIMLANQPLRSGVTATEIAERHEEKLIMLGPVLESLHSELLDKSIDRAFEIMLNNELVPPPPEKISGMQIKVEYISILAQAQKMVGTSSINQFTGFVGGLAGVHPEVLDKIDFDEMVDVYADMTGIPPAIVLPDDAANAKRQARAQQAQMQQLAAMAGPAASAAKDLSETEVNGTSALDALMGGARRQ